MESRTLSVVTSGEGFGRWSENAGKKCIKVRFEDLFGCMTHLLSNGFNSRMVHLSTKNGAVSLYNY